MIDLDARLVDCEPVSVTLALPAATSEYLDQLIDLVEHSGERTSRKELVAALLGATPRDAAKLSRAIRSHRTRTAGDLLGRPDVGEAVLRLDAKKPGPRRKASTS